MDQPKLGVVPNNQIAVPVAKKEAPRLGVVEPVVENVVSVRPVDQGAVVPIILGPVEPALQTPPPAFNLGPINPAPPAPRPAFNLGPVASEGEQQLAAAAVMLEPVTMPEPTQRPLKISRTGDGGMASLSILVSTLTSRAALLGPLLGKLSRQIEAIPEKDVEIVVFEDQKDHTVGWKRNRLIEEAKGVFVAFVDDDDDISDDYVWQIREAIRKNPGVDCIGFRGLMSVAGQGSHQVHYSITNSANVEFGGTFYRYPGHLTPIRKELLLGSRFPDQSFGEDADFSLQLARRKCLKTEAFVDKVLYHYQFNPNTSETHPGRNPGAIMGIDRSIFHVVILSNVADNLRGCIDSILENEPTLPRERIVVVDDGARPDCEMEYRGITWLSGEKPFVFARNANIGIKHCPNDVILMNDDARLETKYGFSSMAFATKSREEIGITSAAIKGFIGNPNQAPWSLSAGMRKEQKNVAFVCVYIPRDTINRVGLLDERFTGYGCLNAEGRVILSNGRTRKISDIVRKLERVEVLSLNERTGCVEPKPVVDWWKSRGQKNQEWVKVSLKRSGRSRFGRVGTVFTPDHRLLTTSGWKEAGQVKPGDKILIHDRRLSLKQRELILGSLLGDGSITSRNGARSCFQVSHSEAQWEYLDLKRKILGSCATSAEQTWTPGNVSPIGNTMVVQSQKKFSTFNLVELSDLHDLTYPGGKKTVSREWLKQVGPLGLAAFYMDDGHIQKKSARISCHGLGKVGTELVVNRLLEFGISCSIDRDARVSKYRVQDPLSIRLRVEETRRFMSLIGAYVPPSMRYKTTNDAPEFDPALWSPEEHQEAYYDEVLTVDPYYPKPSQTALTTARYCLSVKDNENFFTLAGLAHNCEDNDYCHRVQLSDLFIMIYDGCVVEHNSKENKSTFRTKDNYPYLYDRNLKLLQQKWPDLKMGPAK